jgi:nucleotide-binding universal stress UspA family protein
MDMGVKILVPTDGSPASDNALEYAAKLAKMYGAELSILTVVRTGVTTSYHGVSIKEKLEKELTEKAERLVGLRVNKAGKLGVKAEGVIRRGLPDKEIVTLAKESDDIIMVVMGAYGKNFVERQIIGSKTEGVLRKMPELDVPLLIVPHSCRESCKVFTTN